MSAMGNAEPVIWSEDKQKRLQDQLVSPWASDVWQFNGRGGRRYYLRFTVASPSLKIELKYAMWKKFDDSRRSLNAENRDFRMHLPVILRWLDSFTPAIQSLMEREIEHWVLLLRTHLAQTGQLRYRMRKQLLASQEYAEYRREDDRIYFFRQLFSIIRAAYDDRTETEKDNWDMRKMGLAVNLTGGQYRLNFALISQPWLRQLSKDFMKYQITVYSPGSCLNVLKAITSFSQFLETDAPGSSIAHINRHLIMKYISFLQARGLSARLRTGHLSALRIFLETCAHQLSIKGMPRERLIYNDDLPKWRTGSSREIPEEVIEQLRKHLESLDTTTLRMVTILLECGLRISELCSLKLDCLEQDEKQQWYLRFYQIKPKQEHVIPLIDEETVAIIQAQQQHVRKQWGDSCSYLFPSITSPNSPFLSGRFSKRLNKWAREKEIRDATGELYHFQSHQFRHSVGMKLINSDVSLEIIARLLGHRSLEMTQIYARKRYAEVRKELERANRRRKTVNAQGQIVAGDARANTPDVQLLRKGIRGQTLSIGGCGRLLALGNCEHANVCLTCQFWLTSTEDLPALRASYHKATRLKQRASEGGNSIVLENQQRIIPILALRIKSLEEDTSQEVELSVHDLEMQLRADLEEAEMGREEVQGAGLLLAEKYLNQKVIDLRSKIAELEDTSGCM